MRWKALMGLSCLLVCGVSASGQQEAAIYLTGRMLMEDGSPAPHALRVELYCNGRVIRQSNPSKNGTFSFDLGSRQPNSSVMDSRSSTYSVGGVTSGDARSVGDVHGVRTTITGRLDLNGCRVRMEPTAGYAASEIDLATRNVLDKPDVGVVVVRPLAEGEKQPEKVSAQALAAPPKAVKAFERAKEELAKDKVDYGKARKQLENAVRIHPAFPEAWLLLGKVRLSQNDPEGALEAYTDGLASGGSFAPLHLEMAEVALQTGQWEIARDAADRALELKPGDSRGLFFKGLSSYYMQDMEVALSALEELKATSNASDYPAVHLHLGMIYARKGDIPLAASELLTYLEICPEEQLSADRRLKIEKQLQVWESQGLVQK